MKNFKAQVQSDIRQVFHNSSEFAEVMEVRYSGRHYKIPVIMDYEGTKDRTKKYVDHEDSIYICDVVMYVAWSDLKIVPRKNTQIEVNDEIYKIQKVGNEDGEIILYLEVFDE